MVAKCQNCGHSEGVHHDYLGQCLYGAFDRALGVKDGKMCDCPSPQLPLSLL
ncbi:hypothetical protein E3_0367 [Rhodococcus phage E3]|uniref:hypothetical protein n=1 Tax=Rhodococcus phage E3 TaxID=1007869 RepID=UPI0002C6A69F|nr:hypothetical protein M176_gp039 [Rhodococcus phage E3]AEQ20949.1 hypothetical protein E3_0367 [Rhodococcus phage E3]